MNGPPLARCVRLGALRSALCTLIALLPQIALAQGEISGRVLAGDSARPPVQGAEASIPRLSLRALSDSSGRFRLNAVPEGQHQIVLRAIGFKADTSMVNVYHDEVVSLNVVLTRTTGTVLPERVVTAPEERPPAKLVEFTERQKMGTGHFINRDQLAKAEGGFRQTGDLISLVPGVLVRRGSNKIWVASGRAFGGGCAFCKRTVDSLAASDVAAGARPACFMDVYLDGALVFDARYPKYGLFDVNGIPPEHIAGIEVYASPAQTPAKYNRTGGGCGVLLILTR